MAKQPTSHNNDPRSEFDAVSHVTVRGILIGCVLCAIIAIGAPYGRQLIKGTSLALT